MKQMMIAWVAVAMVLMGGSMVGATQILPSGEDSLQEIFNGFTVDGDSSVNVHDDHLSDTIDSYWEITATGSSNSTFIAEIAGFSEENSVGLYDFSDPNNRLELFSGGNSDGDRTTVSIFENGLITSLVQDVENPGVFSVQSAQFSGNKFGYYLTTGEDHTFFSDTSLNKDGYDHLVVFQGNDRDRVQLPGAPEGFWTDNEFIFAWEDLFNGGDQDYNDMVFMVESIHPTPEPGTMALLGLGLIGLGVASRKRMRGRKSAGR